MLVNVPRSIPPVFTGHGITASSPNLMPKVSGSGIRQINVAIPCEVIQTPEMSVYCEIVYGVRDNELMTSDEYEVARQVLRSLPAADIRELEAHNAQLIARLKGRISF